MCSDLLVHASLLRLVKPGLVQHLAELVTSSWCHQLVLYPSSGDLWHSSI